MNTAGYDFESGLYLFPTVVVPPIPESPTRAEAREAAKELLALVDQFPFADENHKSAWLAALLTPLARFAIDGSTPFFMIDASTPGSGKTLLCDLIAVVATGRRVAKLDYPDDDSELSKSLLALAIGGDGLILWDNVAAPFGGSALDAAITAGSIRGRILSKSEMTPALPFTAVQLGTGNNVAYKGDFLRRVIPIRLEPMEEHPEARTGFTHSDLIGYAELHRGRFLAAALTLLKAYFVAGQPDQGLSAFGSFESWSKLVRGCVHWATDRDPCATRAGLTSNDPEAQSRANLILGWAELTESENGRALTAGEALRLVEAHPTRFALLREAFEAWGRDGNLPTVRVLGNRLPGLRGRVVDGRRLESVPLPARATGWKVVTVGGDSTQRTRGD